MNENGKMKEQMNAEIVTEQTASRSAATACKRNMPLEAAADQSTSSTRSFSEDDVHPPVKKFSVDAPVAFSDGNKLTTTGGQGVKATPKRVIVGAESGENREGCFISVYAHRKGEREEMQDKHLIKNVFALPLKDLRRSALFALFDGHGGRAAAEHCAIDFPKKLASTFSKYCNLEKDDLKCAEKFLKKIFIETYKTVDDDFLDRARQHMPPLKDGATVCTLLLLDDFIYAANVGDTKAIVGRWKPETNEFVAMPLTIDHHPQKFDERMRIQKAGGVVKDGRVMGVLEVSRSIGDGPFKSHGVSCVPDVKKLTLTQHDFFLLLACDGLWKVFEPKASIDFIFQRFNSLKKLEKEPYQLWVRVCDDLCAEAVLRGSGDNVSVVLVVFPPSIQNANFP